GAALARAGVPLREIDPRRLRLVNAGKEIAFSLSGTARNRFGPNSAIEFYGTALDTEYTDTNVYWLSWDGKPGRRMASRKAVPAPGTAPLGAMPATVHYEENHLYSKMIYALSGDVPHWFWALVPARQRKEFRLTAAHVAPNTPARLVISLWGHTLSFTANPDHHTRLYWNGTLLEDARWDGQNGHRLEAALPAGAVRTGENVLAVECPGDTGAGDVDQVALDWVELTYDRQPVLDSRQLSLSLPEPAQPRRCCTVTGVTSNAQLLDVTDAADPIRLQGMIGNSSLRFTVSGRRYLVATQPLTPSWIRRAIPLDTRALAGGADYLILAADPFIPALKPLAARRRQQGLRVVTVPINTVYDTCSGGVFTPLALRDFVREACTRWKKPAPRFLLLVGDANYDYRDYLGTGSANYVPAAMVYAPGNQPVATDSFFACVIGEDHVPDLAVGRLPVRSTAETQAVVDKILRYERLPGGDWQRRALFVSDHEGQGNMMESFEAICRGLAQCAAEQGMKPTLLPLRDTITALPAEKRKDQVRSQFTPRILDSFAQGCLLLEYQGHGMEERWSGMHALTLADMTSLLPSAGYPLCIEISCFTGWFDKPNLPDGHSLSEKLLLSPRGGAIACITPSRLGGTNLDRELIPYLLAHRDVPIGTALCAARRTFLRSTQPGIWDPVETYNLLGDPALTLRWPAEVRKGTTE
ncbi:MAG TPA: C25 family cysteine peptidase, partial [Armatimonadota bacterium]|nr:C25 family cysteine peptidase [Armatimonadota bacterium]